MSALSYCAAADLYSFGLPRGALPNPGRLLASVDAGANVLAIDQHGFAHNDPVTFRAESGGSLPSPLVAGVVYYAIPVTDDGFSVSASVDGAALDLTTAGSHILVIAPLPIAAAIAWASRLIDNMCPAHLVPFEANKVPEIVRMTCAELAAGKLLGRQGSQSKSLSDMVDAATKRIERWASGVPIKGEQVPPAANVAVSARAPFLDARGWNRRDGGIP